MKILGTSLAALGLWAAAVSAAPKKPPTNTNWSGATAISPICQPDPTRGSQSNDVAVNSGGLTIAAWDQFSYSAGGGASIGAAVQSGGRWSAPFTISGTTGFAMTPRVAAGAEGTLAVSWVLQEPVGNGAQQKIQVAVRQAAATTWTIYTLAAFTAGGVAITRSVPLAIDAAGNLTAAWNIWDGTRNIVQSATLPKGAGAWLPSATLSGPNTDALYFGLAVNARGDAAVAYSLSPYSGYLSGTWAEYVFRSAATGTWTSPVVISETIPATTGYVTGPQVALDANGLATVIYMGYGLEAARQLPDLTWTAPARIITSSVPGASFLSPDIGMDANGNAVVAVAIFDPTINVDRSSVWVARGTPQGTWTPALRLTDPAVPVDAYATRVAVSPDGLLAMIGWIDHYHGAVQVSSFTGGAWAAPTTIGRGTAWAAFQELLGLEAGSSGVARAIWKNAKSGTQTMASSYDAKAGTLPVFANQRVAVADGGEGAGPGLALRLAGENPSRRGTVPLQLTLPAGGPAWLELFDVAGRLMARREVGSLGAGTHTVDLADGRRLAPGIYLVRLCRGDAARTARITLL